MNTKPNLLDYINCRILDVLSKNSSLPFVELAKQIGISDATIHTRVKKLLALGVIKKFTIFVDNNLLGYDHLAFINLKIEKGKTEETTKNLMEIDETEFITVLRTRKEEQMISLHKEINQKTKEFF
jgi:Lrp/AsnC family transcriptional regulator, regulator for asnA, asnC and gidA